jgi:hypothetical protein
VSKPRLRTFKKKLPKISEHAVMKARLRMGLLTPGPRLSALIERITRVKYEC